MSGIGGRNVVFAWIVGVLCAAVVVTLAVLAVPLLFTSLTAAESDDAAPATPGGAGECRDLYTMPLWASLEQAPGSELAVSEDAPVTTATTLVDALAPRVAFTCTWTAEAGSISTTVAEVGTDAGSIAEASLPGLGFSCATTDARTLCTRTEEDLVETIETGEGLWVSTSQRAWHPSRYATRVADAVFAD